MKEEVHGKDHKAMKLKLHESLWNKRPDGMVTDKGRKAKQEA